MAEQRDLLPCPFCGGDPDPREWASNKAPGDLVFYGPGCSKCGSTAQSPEEWNRRILPPSAAPSQFEAEPGQSSNPAVARVIAAARNVVGGHFAMQSLLDAKRELADAIDALDQAVPLTGPTNEGHGR